MLFFFFLSHFLSPIKVTELSSRLLWDLYPSFIYTIESITNIGLFIAVFSFFRSLFLSYLIILVIICTQFQHSAWPLKVNIKKKNNQDTQGKGTIHQVFPGGAFSFDPAMFTSANQYSLIYMVMLHACSLFVLVRKRERHIFMFLGHFFYL